MERTLIAGLTEHVGKTVSISGWVEVRRDHGKLIFLDIRDRSGVVQAVVMQKEVDAFGTAETLRPQFVVSVEGGVRERPENMQKEGEANGTIEMSLTKIEVLAAAHELPFDMDAELNLDTYLDYLPLALRTQSGRDIFAIQATATEAFRTALRELDFTEFQSPTLTGGDAEGGASAFKVDYYHDKPAFLATSPQFYKQIMVGVYERAFSTPKVFRGEKHATTRHLSEYSSLDFEMGFITDHTDVMAVLEKTIRHMVAQVVERHSDALARCEAEPPRVPSAPFPVLKLAEAQEIIEKEFGGSAVGEPDLEPEHERQICEWALREKESDFIFITHYPVSKRPFYTYEDENDPGFTKSFDLIFRGLEITTGGQRIHDYDMLVGKIKERNLNPEAFSFYLQAFKFGMPPHGGAATGLERFTARMLGLPNIKEATLFPRDMTRVDTRLAQDDGRPAQDGALDR